MGQASTIRVNSGWSGAAGGRRITGSSGSGFRVARRRTHSVESSASNEERSVAATGISTLRGRATLRIDASRHPDAREFINRCEVASLSPLYENLKTYITHKFERVNVAPTFIDDSAFEAIRERWTKVDPSTRALKNNLYPLIVNNTVTRALNRAAELGLPIINGDLIKEL